MIRKAAAKLEATDAAKAAEISGVRNSIAQAAFDKAAKGNYLVDAGHSPFGGPFVLCVGTAHFKGIHGSMGFNHIVEKHANDILDSLYGEQKKDQKPQALKATVVYNTLMEMLKNGTGVFDKASTGGIGSTYKVSKIINNVDVKIRVVISGSGEVIQANGMGYDKKSKKSL